MKVENLFLLLRVGLENEKPSEVSTDAFSEMSLKDWQELRAMADKQSVSAIVFDGLNTLVEEYGKEIIGQRFG